MVDPHYLLMTTLTAVFAGASPAQTLHTVTTEAEFTNAIAAAAPGDVIEVPQTLFVSPFRLTKGITIVGDLRVNVGSRRVVTPTGFDVEFAIPAGQRAYVVGVGFLSWSAVGGICPSLGRVRVTGGACSFEDCFIAAPVDLSNTSTVRFDRCSLSNISGAAGTSPPTLAADNCHVELVDSSVVGRVSGSNFACLANYSTAWQWNSSSALVATDSTVIASHSTFTTHFLAGATVAGIESVRSQVWLTDSTVGPNASWSSVPDALRGPVRHARSRLTGSVGASAIADQDLVGITTSGAFARGSNYTITTHASGGGLPMALLLTPGFASASATLPVIAQPLWAAAPIDAVASGVSLGGSGRWFRTISIPSDPALQHRRISLFAAALVGQRVQLSPMVGGSVR